MYKGPSVRRQRRAVALDLAGEVAVGALPVPLLDPPVRANVGEDILKVLAHVRALALDLLAPVEVQVALEAVLGLVRVREARVPRGRLDADLGQGCYVLGHRRLRCWRGESSFLLVSGIFGRSDLWEGVRDGVQHSSRPSNAQELIRGFAK